MIPQVELKQYAISNLRVIVNALCALEGNGLENDHPLSVPLLAPTMSSSTERILKNLFPDFLEGASYHRVCQLLSSAITPSKWLP